MFIIVADDIIRGCLDEHSEFARDRIDMLTELSLVVRYGIHVVYIPLLRTDAKIKEELKSKLPVRVFSLLSKNNNNQSLHVIESLVKEKLVITADHSEYKAWKAKTPYVVNWAEHTNFRALYPTFLVTENVLDARFYESVVLYYKKINGIKTAKINYLPIMGGGGSLAGVVCDLDAMKAGVWFAIADSDKYAPNDKEKSTASTLRKDYSNLAEPWGSYYVMQMVCEIENLIPIKILKEIKNCRAGFWEKDLSYYDIKCGLSFSVLYDDVVYNYWRTIFTGTNFARRNKEKKRCKDEDDYRKAVRNDKAVVTNFGSSILKTILNGPKAFMLNEIECADLTDAQKYEWESIGKMVFCWTCSLGPQRA